MCALQEKCPSTSVEALGKMLAVVALAKQSFDLERRVTKREQTLVEVE